MTVNCETIPSSLIDSELFGHVKGSFTGATRQHTGKFERATDDTLFLDEAAELPLEIQARLLRVIQEHTIEPVGGSLPCGGSVDFLRSGRAKPGILIVRRIFCTHSGAL